jgi:membrane fusion protein (multidrug efflux system)
MTASNPHLPLAPAPRSSLRARAIPIAIGAGTVVLLALGGGMIWHAEAGTNKVALTDGPRAVTMVVAKASSYQPSRTYVGTLRPWVEASVGPQLVAAYVQTVLVRPGDLVKRGEVLATLDCRNAQSAMTAVAHQARAIEKSQRALSNQADRTSALLDGGFVSSNDVEQEQARSGAEAARLEAQKATLANSALEVSDCVLRAPFDGEIGDRFIDPGAFVRPGTALVSVVDRAKVRFTADVPEVDFAVVAPATAVRLHLFATGQDMVGVVARRGPSADGETRTMHFEVDLTDPTRKIPVGTTGEVRIDVGAPLPATEIPLLAATVRGARATVFTVDGDVARAKTVPVLGELGGSLFVGPVLAPDTLVVTQGRTLLHDGDHVDMTKGRPVAKPAPTAAEGTR